MKDFFDRFKYVRKCLGSRAETRDYQAHIAELDILTRKKMSREVITHSPEMYGRGSFDQDPQGMGMPFKEFITGDSSRNMGEIKGRQVVYEFPNGYGASVLTGEMFHTDAEHPYEVGLLKHGKLDYRALGGEVDDVLGFQTDADLMIILAKLMDLPKEEK